MPVPQPPLRDESSITDASSTDSKTEQSSAARFQPRAAGERWPSTIPTKKTLMILSGNCH